MKKKTWNRLSVSGLPSVAGAFTWKQMTCSISSVAWSSSGSIRWHYRTT
jgi:hypothetical protein